MMCLVFTMRRGGGIKIYRRIRPNANQMRERFGYRIAEGLRLAKSGNNNTSHQGNRHDDIARDQHHFGWRNPGKDKV